MFKVVYTQHGHEDQEMSIGMAASIHIDSLSPVLFLGKAESNTARQKPAEFETENLAKAAIHETLAHCHRYNNAVEAVYRR